MAIAEENGNLLMEWSLSAQLQEASDPIPEADLVEQSQASAPEAHVVQQSQQIEW